MWRIIKNLEPLEPWTQSQTDLKRFTTRPAIIHKQTHALKHEQRVDITTNINISSAFSVWNNRSLCSRPQRRSPPECRSLEEEVLLSMQNERQPQHRRSGPLRVSRLGQEGKMTSSVSSQWSEVRFEFELNLRLLVSLKCCSWRVQEVVFRCVRCVSLSRFWTSHSSCFHYRNSKEEKHIQRWVNASTSFLTVH